MKQIKFIDSLTPLRGIAAIMVMFFHYDAFLMMQGFPRLISTNSTFFIARGDLWVDFFFILSGFVICHVYSQQLSNLNKKVIKKYIWARFSRIYPLHFFIMILFAIHFLALLVFVPEFADKLKPPSGFNDFVLQLFFLDAIGLIDGWSWNVPSWSVASEWWIYLLAILVIPFINKNKNTITALALVVSLFALILIHHFTKEYAAGTPIWRITSTFRCLFEFSIGVSIYQFYKSLNNTQSIWASDWMMFLIGIGVVLNLHFDIYLILIIPFFSVFLLCAALNNGLPSRILNAQPFVFLGDLSYSIYLIHIFWLMRFGRMWVELYYKPHYPESEPTSVDHFIWLTVLFFATISSSYLTHRFVELKAQKKLRTIFP
ncbi:acyltransferase [Aquimarina sp. MMG015]|uniref:acyltransferase family protein n=1 Tax=unclassified Aquimarina TaxID=2627091 RepID=UPI000E4929C3|nr:MULTISPECIES: acyltransferase [unclassified Aquimarina]AXT54624.1 acyltransferase [Aquimarina sp. AD1]MBQ4804518.1 acyltransferase [Aquimarina sp. MMG015]RKN14728.1 acyltransferase [Aquimarina sp. AD1]